MTLIACIAACVHAATLAVAADPTGFPPGDTLDLFRPGFAFTGLALSAFPFTSAGRKLFRFKAIGNPNSTGYLSFFDSIQNDKK